MKKIYIIGTLLVITLGLIALRPEQGVVQKVASTPGTSAITASTSAEESTPRANTASVLPAVPSAMQRPEATSTPEMLVTPMPNVTIAVASTTYAVYTAVGSTVLDAMQAAASSTSFIFTGREYPSLGYFVESIGGKKNADGYYWFLYVNGKSSDTGASQTNLSTGDAVEWRYKKEY